MRVSKSLAFLAIALLAFLLSSCASIGDSSSSDYSSPAPASAVPGESTSDDRYAPGPPGSSGSIRW
jgi:PBP1b-binding outer membrane lipoprotein LpoB